jgi:hypothetical protein
MLSTLRSQWATFAFAAALSATMFHTACGGGKEPNVVNTADNAASGNTSSKAGNGGMGGTMDISVTGLNDTVTASGTGGAAPASSSSEGGSGNLTYQWDAIYGGNGASDEAVLSAVAVDKQGNVVVAGAYKGQLDFDGPAGANPPNTSVGGYDIFVAKYDKMGKLVWRKAVGDGQDQSAKAVAVDANGRVAICGIIKGAVNFGGNNVSYLGPMFPNMYLAVFDAAGNHIASKAYGDGAGDSGFCYGIAFDPNGNVVMTGQFQSKVTFGPGFIINAAGGLGDYDMFVTKLTPNATSKSFDPVFAKAYGVAMAQSQGNAVTVNAAGEIAVGGWSNGTINFGMGNLTPKMDLGTQPVFAKLDPMGTAKFQVMVASGVSMNDDSEVRGLAFHVNGDLLVGGVYRGQADFGMPVGVVKSVGGSNDQFVARYDTTNKLLWAAHIGDASDDQLNGLAVDASGFPVYAGSLQGTVQLNSKTKLVGMGVRSAEVVKLANTDGHGWWGGAFGDAQLQEAMGVAVDSSSNTIIAGNFRGSMDFGGGARTAPGGSQSFFLAGFGP